MIFYHFHHLEYIDEHTVNINAFKKGIGPAEKLVYEIYIPYLKALDQAKRMLLEKFELMPIITSHPGFVRQSKLEKIRMIKATGVSEVYNRIVEKIIYMQGKKKDIVNI